jgi:hypothetical protein
LVSVRGRIDLIDRDSAGRPAIKDLKTKTPVTDHDLEVYALQGLLYFRALGLDGDPVAIPPSVIVVSRAGVEEISLGSRLVYAASILEDRLRRLAEIETAREIPQPPSDAPCEDCCYALICPRSPERVAQGK